MTAVPVVITVRRYRCPFCTWSKAKRASTVAHIARCWDNPEVRGCKTCALFEQVPTGAPCFPDRPCSCNDGWEACLDGLDLTDGLKTGCPRWQGASNEPTTTKEESLS